eukprot:6984856-Prymnesium_polylepis.1
MLVETTTWQAAPTGRRHHHLWHLTLVIAAVLRPPRCRRVSAATLSSLRVRAVIRPRERDTACTLADELMVLRVPAPRAALARPGPNMGLN